MENNNKNRGELMTNDLLIEIFARLPVKSLVRFTSVSKFFYHLIKKDVHFMHKHYEISRKTKDFAVLEYKLDYGDYFLFYKEEESSSIGSIYLNTPKSTTGLLHVKCCYGMFCMITDNYGPFMEDDAYPSYDTLVWNPSTRGTKHLPAVTIPYRPPENVFLSWGYGFGLPNNMSWKVVILLYFFEHWHCPIHETVMVYSHVGDSGSWRQIQTVPNVPVYIQMDFYFRGRYYWRVNVVETEPAKLLWFDLDDEVFGTIELPARFNEDVVTIMNDTIALVMEHEDCLEIWLMSEDSDNISWHKNVSISCGTSMSIHEYSNSGRSWNEIWYPIGIWNVNNHLLVFPYITLKNNQHGFMGEIGYTPHLISIDLVTQEMKIIYLTRERRRIDMGSGEVYDGTNVSIADEWASTFPYCLPKSYTFRVYCESLFLL